mgnify:CR=1 FL=1
MNISEIENVSEDLRRSSLLNFISSHKHSYFISIKKSAVIMSWLPDGATIQERLYLFCHSMMAPPKCAHCGVGVLHLRDRSFFKGFTSLCSHSCIMASTKRQQAYMKTCKQKYGGGSPRAAKHIQEKYNKTWCNNPQNQESIGRAKKTREKTCLEKYGETNVFSVPFIQEQAHKNSSKSMHSYRSFTSESGVTYNIRGYEDKAITILEKLYGVGGFIADDFKTPGFTYQHHGTRRYYPDFFIPTKNLIIEVKSWYWLKKQPEKNLAIFQRALELGFNFEFWVFSGKQLTVINTLQSLQEELK